MNEYVVSTAGCEATVEAEAGTSPIDIVMLALDEKKLDGVGLLAQVEGGEYVGDQTMYVSGFAIARRLEEAGMLEGSTEDNYVH